MKNSGKGRSKANGSWERYTTTTTTQAKIWIKRLVGNGDDQGFGFGLCL